MGVSGPKSPAKAAAPAGVVRPAATPGSTAVDPAIDAKAAGIGTTDAVTSKTVDASVIHGPTAAAQATLPNIPESFPIGALSELDARGLTGQTFMLDGGSLRGMKLVVRRVVDGEQPGFEITFKVCSSKLPALLKTLRSRKAKPGPMEFQGAELGEDGVAHFDKKTASLSPGSTHAAPETDSERDKWTLAHSAAKGSGEVEPVHTSTVSGSRAGSFGELRLSEIIITPG